MMLFLGGKSIAFATSHTLNISADTKEISSKDNVGGWNDSEVGLLSWTVNSENIMADKNNGHSFDDLFDLMIKKEKIDAIFCRKNEELNEDISENGWTPTKSGIQYTGKVLITSLEQGASNGENATFKVDFTGCGKLEKVDATSASTKSTSTTSTTSTSK
jgi:TP901-1 family phage major tail protein